MVKKRENYINPRDSIYLLLFGMGEMTSTKNSIVDPSTVVIQRLPLPTFLHFTTLWLLLYNPF